jgi:hypothetical protein
LCILIFSFKAADEKTNLVLISSWIKFWFVTVVPKCLNCATLQYGINAQHNWYGGTH